MNLSMRNKNQKGDEEEGEGEGEEKKDEEENDEEDGGDSEYGSEDDAEEFVAVPFKYSPDTRKFAVSLYKLSKDDLSGLSDIVVFTMKNKDKSAFITDYIKDYFKVIDIQKFKKLINQIPKSNDLEAHDRRKKLLGKVLDSKGDHDDIFGLLNNTGDPTGKIDIDKFNMLTKRLGIHLTQHKTHELFADLKGGDKKAAPNAGTLVSLNKDEFKKSLDLLKQKQLGSAMAHLGITKGELLTYLAFLLLMLLLLFSFIFVGIKAFAVGGAFSAVINSVLPAVGATGMGSGEDKKKKIDTTKIKEAYHEIAAMYQKAVKEVDHDVAAAKKEVKAVVAKV